MALAFQLFSIEQLPTDDIIKTSEQLVLGFTGQNNQEVSVSKLERIPLSYPFSLVRYDVEHDFLVRLKYPARAVGHKFQEYVTPFKFEAFVGPFEPELGFRPILVKTKKKVAADLINRLNEGQIGFKASPIEVDFTLLRPKLQVIHGAWFGKMRQPHLRSTGVFGTNVDKSQEFQHAESVGQLTNLQIEIEDGDTAHPVMIAREGAVVLYQNYQTDRDSLSIVYPTLTSLLAGCVQRKLVKI